jgi:hypothetical protein
MSDLMQVLLVTTLAGATIPIGAVLGFFLGVIGKVLLDGHRYDTLILTPPFTSRRLLS